MFKKGMTALSEMEWFRAQEAGRQHEVMLTYMIAKAMIVALLGFTLITASCHVLERAVR